MLSEYDEGVERVLDMQSEAYKMQKVLKELHTILSSNEVLRNHNLLYVREQFRRRPQSVSLMGHQL